MEHSEDTDIPDVSQASALRLEDVLLPEAFAQEKRPIDFPQLFGRSTPVEIEIGSGKGTFLLHRAKLRPEVNFLGIEWARAYCAYTAGRLHRWGLRNARMIRCDAEQLFRERVPDNSLQRVHIYFPDPWPKAKHLRRRLVKPPFISLLHHKLKVGGQLAVVTDHMHYARQMAWVILRQPGFAVVPFPRTSGHGGEIVGTNFERKYIAQGRRFFSLAVMKWR